MNDPLPLNLKYRPEALDEMYGADEFFTPIYNFLQREDRPKTYLFYGPPGCGKTTLARIFANELQGELKEYNISNTTGVDAARGIIKKLKYKSLRGIRVLVFNECHRASNNFQDAMLETWEEPPHSTFFILCTTEPEKLLPAVLSRCTQIELRPLNRRDMTDLLKDVCKAEGVEVPNQLIQQIVKIANGVPRDALVLLDKTIDLDEEGVEDFLTGIRTIEATTFELCRALENKVAWKNVAKIISELKEDPERVRYAVLGWFSKNLLRHGKPQDWFVLDVFSSSFIYTKKPGLIKACFEVINTDN